MRVADGAEVRIVRGDAVGKFVKPGLPGKDRASLREQIRNSGVVGGDVVFKEQRTAGGTDAFRAEDVFQRDGDAVKGTAVLACREFPIGFGGGGTRFFSSNCEECVELGVEELYLCQ